MTATVQIPNTPEFFAKVEKRLAEAIHSEVKEMAENEAGAKAGRFPHYHRREYVRKLRGIHLALKEGLPLHIDAETYWSLMNE